MAASDSKPSDRITLAIIFAILTCSTIWWTLKDKTPPPWDPSDHMIAAYDYYRPIAHADFTGFAKELFATTHYYAPLVHLATAAFFLVLGPSRISGIAINLVSLAISLWAAYWIGEKLYGSEGGVPARGDQSGPGERDGYGPRAIARSLTTPGVLAALLAACYHFPAWLIHDAFLDYPLTAIITVSFALLIRAGDFQNRRHALVFGLSAGLGMLTKQSFAFFVVLPAIYIAGRVILKKDIRAILNVTLAGLLALAVSAIWYLPHLKDVIAIYRMNQQAALDENEAPLFSFMSNAVYVHGLVSMQVQVLFGLLFFCGLVYSLARKRKESLLLYLWILSGILCFTLVANKDMRYTVPVLPAVALLSVSWLGYPGRQPESSAPPIGRAGAWSGKLKGGVVAVTVIWAFLSFFNAQWPRAGMGSYIDTPRFRWMVFARNYFSFDHRPLPDDWGVPEVVSALSRSDPNERSGQPATYTSPPKIGVVVNLPYLNPSSVALYARLQAPGRAGPPIVTVIWLVNKSAADQILDCDYLLVRTGLDRAEWVAPLERYAEDLIRTDPSGYTRVAGFPIPMDGAEVVLYKINKG